MLCVEEKNEYLFGGRNTWIISFSVVFGEHEFIHMSADITVSDVRGYGRKEDSCQVSKPSKKTD